MIKSYTLQIVDWNSRDFRYDVRRLSNDAKPVDTDESTTVGSRTQDRAKLGPGLVKKIADLTISNHSKGKSGCYAHAARVGMQNQ
jgi:hypothetical protein